jgi:predicted DNA-binding protein
MKKREGYVSFRADKELIEKIRIAAENDNRKVSDWVRLLIEKRLEELHVSLPQQSKNAD